jgi:hypothetical protein
MAVVTAASMSVASYEVVNNSGTRASIVQQVAGIALCPSGEIVSGVWINAADTRDNRFARLRQEGKVNRAFYFASLPHGDSASFVPDVGCGTTTAISPHTHKKITNWQYNDRGPVISASITNSTIVCDDQSSSCEADPELTPKDPLSCAGVYINFGSAPDTYSFTAKGSSDKPEDTQYTDDTFDFGDHHSDKVPSYGPIAETVHHYTSPGRYALSVVVQGDVNDIPYSSPPGDCTYVMTVPFVK